MLAEFVQLNGTLEHVGCPECGVLLLKCSYCRKRFLVGDNAVCVEGDNALRHHYHRKCFGLKQKKSEVKDE